MKKAVRLLNSISTFNIQFRYFSSCMHNCGQIIEGLFTVFTKYFKMAFIDPLVAVTVSSSEFLMPRVRIVLILYL